MRVALIAGIVTPYTHRLFETLGQRLDGGLDVFACSKLEPGRHWTLPEPVAYRRRVLSGLRLHQSYVSHIYLNPAVVAALAGAPYDAVVVNDFSPTMMLASAVARLRRIPLVIGTDGQPDTDPGRRSAIHRWARRLVVPRCAAGVGASRGSLELLGAYGLRPENGFLAPLAPGWDFEGPSPPFEDRPFDLLFCGHLDEETKGALFFAEVVAASAARGRALRVRVTGDGPLRGALEERLRAAGLPGLLFDGYLPQERLAEAYTSAKLLAFPSRGDTWGLVANEAIQCGTPVLVSPHARVASELVEPAGVGRSLPLSPALWADAVGRFLDDRAAWDAAHARTAAATRSFTLDRMADGYLGALRHAVGAAAPDAASPLRSAS